jgi:peptide/nickel transport system permease protein
MQLGASDHSVPVEATPAGQIVPVPTLRQRSGPPRVLTLVLRNPKATFGAVILLAFAAVALLAPVIAPGDPTDFVSRPHLAPSWEHPLGTTGRGQDVLDQTIWGTRISLGVGVAVGVLTTIIGIVVGMAAGYFGGKIDDALMLVTNVFLIIPGLPLLVTLAAFLKSDSVVYLALVLAVTGWAWPARILRSQTLSLREKDFVSAAQVSGERSWRIILQEILPNMMSIVAASFLGSTIYAIGAEAGLEFLGLGNPSVVSWGTILYWAGNDAALLTGSWWTIVPAGTCIALVAFGFALLNYAIDEITNPRLRALRESSKVLKRKALRGGQVRATPVVRGAGS